MNQIVERMLFWFRWKPQPISPPRGIRVNVPRSLMQRLRIATAPTATNHEPLAFVQVRYASEEVRDVVVAIGIIPFANEAYVDGDAGANFDTRWSMAIANEQIRHNVGLMLAHSHGGSGPPGFSRVDRATNAQVMAPLSFGVDVAPYGAIVLSDDDQTAVVAVNGRVNDANVAVVADRLGGLDLTA